MKLKNLFFWSVFIALIILVFVVVFLDYEEESIQFVENISDDFNPIGDINESDEGEEYEEVFEGEYNYTNTNQDIFYFEAKKKEGITVVFHYFTLERYAGGHATVVLRNSPFSVEIIPMEEVKYDMYNFEVPKSETFIVQDPFLIEQSERGSLIASNQLGLNIGTKGCLGTDISFKYNKEGHTDDFIVTCDDVEEDVAVIEYRMGKTSIYSEDGCIILQAENKEDFYKVTDKFVMHLGGVF